MSKKSAAAGKQAPPAPKPKPSPVDPQQLKSALLALYSHLSSSAANAPSKQLLEEEADISLVLALKKVPLKQRNNPIRIEICLFTKDPPQPADYDASSGIPLENPVKSKLQERPVPGVTKVLSVSKLRNNYKQFAERRRLLGSYGLFMADARIIPLLPALLGSKFFEKKKQPVSVNLDQHDFSKELIRARDSTYMFISTGATIQVRVSRTSFSRQQSFENIQAALDTIALHVPKQWAGIQSIHIKSHDSIALPVYSSGQTLNLVVPNPEPVKPAKASSKKKKDAPKKKKRALSTKKEEAKPEAGSSKKQKTEAGSAKKDAAAAPAPAKAAPAAAAAATPAKAKPTPAKRARDASPARAAAAAPASPAPSAKKAKSAVAAAPAAAAAAAPAPVTPVKSASQKKANGAASKSAVKAEATPKPKSAASKKAPSTVASKKK